MGVFFLAGPQVRLSAAFSDAFCHASDKGHESIAGLVRGSYLKRNRIPVKCALQRVLDSRHGEPLGDYNRLDVNDLSVHNDFVVEDAGMSPPKMRSAEKIFGTDTRLDLI